MPEYIRWDAEGVEKTQPEEEQKIKDVSAQFNRFQMMNFNEHHHCLRGTHLKTQGVCPPDYLFPLTDCCLVVCHWQVQSP